MSFTPLIHQSASDVENWLPPLRIGMRVGDFRISEIDARTIKLRVVRWARTMLVGGLLLTGWFWTFVLIAVFQRRWNDLGLHTEMLLAAGPLLMARGAFLLGQTWVIERSLGQIRVARWFAKPKIFDRSVFRAIVLQVTPKSIHNRESISLRLRFDDDQVLSLGNRLTTTGGAVHLASMAVELARILMLPVRGKGLPTQGGEKLARAVWHVRTQNETSQ
jgi:hypothetical protein